MTAPVVALFTPKRPIAPSGTIVRTLAASAGTNRPGDSCYTLPPVPIVGVITTDTDTFNRTQFPLPKGWHELVKYSDVNSGQEDLQLTAARENMGLGDGLRAIADFDGDGRPDIARILESNDGNHCQSVFITYFPAGRPAHYNVGPGSVFLMRPIDYPDGIETLCGKNGNCDSDVPKFLKLQRPAAWVVDSANSSILVWDTDKSAWKAIVLQFKAKP